MAGQSTDVSPDSCHVPPLRKLDVEMRVQGHDSPAASSMTTTLDLATSLDKRTALRHDGIGIIADATTKLLYSYDEPFRGEIIDYFFKPQCYPRFGKEWPRIQHEHVWVTREEMQEYMVDDEAFLRHVEHLL